MIDVVVGEEMEVRILKAGKNPMDGISKLGCGYIIIVPDTAVGDVVRIRLTKVFKTFGFGEKI